MRINVASTFQATASRGVETVVGKSRNIVHDSPYFLPLHEFFSRWRPLSLARRCHDQRQNAPFNHGFSVRSIIVTKENSFHDYLPSAMPRPHSPFCTFLLSPSQVLKCRCHLTCLRRVLGFAWTMVLALSSITIAADRPARLALVTASPGTADAVAVLTAALSTDSRLALLERAPKCKPGSWPPSCPILEAFVANERESAPKIF